MKCSSCGKEIQSDFKMCPYCGAAVETEQETAFISLPVEAYDEPDEEVYEESRKERKARLKREAQEQQDEDDDSEEYGNDDEDEYYEIPLKKILIIVAAIIVLAGLGIGGYFMFFANPLTASTKTIEAGDTVDPLDLVSLKSSAEDKYTISVSQNNIDASKVGDYTVVYKLQKTDGGKSSTKTFTFKVVDTTAPVISVADSIVVPLNSTFRISESASVTDNADGIMDASGITVDGTLNTASAGTYPITLSISDAAGNKASVGIKAVVEDMGDADSFMTKIKGSWYNEDTGLVIAFSSDGTYKLDVGNYQSEGFGTGLLSFTSVNSTLTKATATWGYKGYYTDNNENIVYENVVSQTVKIDTGASGDDLITVDLGFGDGAMDFTYLYN